MSGLFDALIHRASSSSKVLVRFDDGSSREYDFTPYPQGGDQHRMIGTIEDSSGKRVAVKLFTERTLHDLAIHREMARRHPNVVPLLDELDGKRVLSIHSSKQKHVRFKLMKHFDDTTGPRGDDEARAEAIAALRRSVIDSAPPHVRARLENAYDWTHDGRGIPMRKTNILWEGNTPYVFDFDEEALRDGNGRGRAAAKRARATPAGAAAAAAAAAAPIGDDDDEDDVEIITDEHESGAQAEWHEAERRRVQRAAAAAAAGAGDDDDTEIVDVDMSPAQVAQRDRFRAQMHQFAPLPFDPRPDYAGPYAPAVERSLVPRERLFVGPSTIPGAGSGLFARGPPNTRVIKAGDLIPFDMNPESQLSRKEGLKKRNEGQPGESGHLVVVGHHGDPYDNSKVPPNAWSIASFINHNDDRSKVKFKRVSKRNPRTAQEHVFMQAKEDIETDASGTVELFTHYKWASTAAMRDEANGVGKKKRQ